MSVCSPVPFLWAFCPCSAEPVSEQWWNREVGLEGRVEELWGLAGEWRTEQWAQCLDGFLSSGAKTIP